MVFEIASRKNIEDTDIIASGNRRVVHTLDEAEKAHWELPDEDYPLTAGYIDGEYIKPIEFARRLRAYEDSQKQA